MQCEDKEMTLTPKSRKPKRSRTSDLDLDEARWYLGRAYELQQAIITKKEKIRLYKDIAMNITPQLSDMPKNPSPSQSRMADAISKLADLEDELRKDEIGLALVRMETLETISLIEDTKVQLVLIERYINFRNWPDIISKLSYTERHIYRMHEKGLLEIGNALKGQQKDPE